MSVCILIENNQKEKAPFRGYKTALRRAITKTLEKEGFSRSCEVSVTLVSAEEIHSLNRQYRNVDRETDVLSFPMWEESDPDSVAYLGDIILCPKVIFSQAASFGTTFRQEMCLMAIHSTLHLLGWDHMEEDEKKEMFALQEEILALLGEGEVKTERND
jgi:probable rRNA maturation factor